LTAQLLGEVGYDRLSLDVVARRIHVSKATLYRHWGGKVQLVGEAVDRWLVDRPEPGDTGSLRGDLMTAITGPGGLSCAGVSSPITGLLTALCVDPDVAEVLRSRVLAATRADVRVILERALRRGDRVSQWAIDLVEPVLLGFAMHQTALRGTTPSRADVGFVVDLVLLPAIRSSDGAR